MGAARHKVQMRILRVQKFSLSRGIAGAGELACGAELFIMIFVRPGVASSCDNFSRWYSDIIQNCSLAPLYALVAKGVFRAWSDG